VASGVALLGVGGTLVPLLTGGGDGAAAAQTAAPRHTEAVTVKDLVETASLDGDLGYGDSRAIRSRRAGTLTGLVPAGTLVTMGGGPFAVSWLYEVDGRRVPVLDGTIPMWRALGPGVDDGPDVRQLEEDLVALGFADPAVMTVDDEFTSATTAAVKRWQGSLGWEETGTVDPGDVAILDGPVRVASTTATVGDELGPSAPVMDVTGTERQVSLQVSLSEREMVDVGDAVEVVLPDETKVAAHVTDIGRTATAGQNGAAPTIAVTVGLDDAGAAGDYDAAPVDVEVTRHAATGVLAVPVAALLALAEGGYGVEVVSADGLSHLVGVEIGQFADGWVEVTGDVAVGDQVVVPT
jgi:peptidoglycan hydrolase-like protein with peptidoglycan-binding domain